METQAKKGTKKYKDMIKRYEYLPRQVKAADGQHTDYLFKDLVELFQEDVAEEKTFEKILVSWNSNVFKFVVLDSAGNFTQLDRNLNFDTIISLRSYL